MRRQLAVVVGMVLALLPVSTVPTAAAGTATGWTSPKKVAGYARDVDIASNGRGDLVVVWEDEDAVRARFKPAGRRWGRVELVARHVRHHAVTLSRRGRATVVLSDGISLQVFDRRPKGAWRGDRTAPLAHRDKTGCGDEWISELEVASDAVGSLFITWHEYGCVEAYSSFHHYASRAADGTWSRLFDGGGSEAVFPRPGRVLVFRAGDPISVQSGRAGGKLGPERAVGPAGSHLTPRADTNSRGDLVVMARSGASPTMVVMRKPAGAAWSAPQHLPVTTSTSLRNLVLTDTGLIVSTYVRSGERSALLAQTGHIDSELWSPRVAIARGIRGEVATDLAARGDGSAAAVWTRSDWPYTLSTHAATRSASGEWSAPVRLATRRTVDKHAASAPAVLAARAGFTAAFVRNGALVNRYRLPLGRRQASGW